MTQLRIAETEKYAHVTFFFNGGVEKEYPGEDRALVPSPKVATYDLQPEMSEPAVTEECVKRILSGKYDVIILNFANCDMVGHTGVFEAAVKAIEATDDGVGKVVDAILKMGGQCLITADHGNVDQMLDADGVTPFTAHSTDPVPLVMVGHEGKLADGGVLADLAPTMLDMMGLPQPAERNYASYRHIFCTFVEVKSKYNVEFKNDFMLNYYIVTFSNLHDAQPERQYPRQPQ